MKKTILFFLCVLTLVISLGPEARADTGPKPSVTVDFKGIDGEYYVTLLSSVQSTGPHSVENKYREWYGTREIFLKFKEYEDADGYYFLGVFQDCSETDRFEWNYYPPSEFKILIYFPGTDSFAVGGESLERYAFDSYFTAEISGSGIEARQSYNYGKEIFSFVVRVALTLAVELLIAMIFGFLKAGMFRYIMRVNVITQIALNLALNIYGYLNGSGFFYVALYAFLEILVVIVEAALYNSHVNRHLDGAVSRAKVVWYAVLANAASFAAGLWLSMVIAYVF